MIIIQGLRKALVIVVSRYNPTVACFGPVQPVSGVGQTLLDMIPTTFEKSVFGSQGEKGVQYVVPKTFTPPSREPWLCQDEALADDSQQPLRMQQQSMSRVNM